MHRLLKTSGLALPLIVLSAADASAGFLSHSCNGSLPDRHGPSLESHRIEWDPRDLRRDFKPEFRIGGPRDSGWVECQPFGRDGSFCDPRNRGDGSLCRDIDWCRDPWQRPSSCDPDRFDRCGDVYRCDRLVWCRPPRRPHDCSPGNNDPPGGGGPPDGDNDPPPGGLPDTDPPGPGDDSEPPDETDPGISQQPVPSTFVLSATGLGCAGLWNALRRRLRRN